MRERCHVADRISIHAPLAGCDYRRGYEQAIPLISIHAPLAGCDNTLLSAFPTSLHFNPRTPCGVRPVYHGFISAVVHFNPRTPCGVRLRTAALRQSILSFQSTHPLRGATFVLLIVRHIVTISIHAPLAGCDPRQRAPRFFRQNFNPRTPCGVRPLAGALSCRPPRFQSTHPLRGATNKIYTTGIEGAISIHAPLAGCDPRQRLRRI